MNGGNYGTAINPYTAAATTQGGDGFDIAWAVKPDGTPAAYKDRLYPGIYIRTDEQHG